MALYIHVKKYYFLPIAAVTVRMRRIAVTVVFILYLYTQICENLDQVETQNLLRYFCICD